jgi:hypothetical protein
MIKLCACLRAQPGFISPNDQSAVTWPPPAVQREERRQFWAAITTGQTSEDAASVAGVSPAVGIRLSLLSDDGFFVLLCAHLRDEDLCS